VTKHVTKHHVTKHHVTKHVTEDETTTEEWAVSAGALTFEGRVYVPDSDELRPKVITSTMIIPNQSHQTYEARRQYAYRASEPAVEGVTIDFVTDLPESTASTYTGILVVVDRLTKMAIYLPCRKDVDSPELACKHGVPSNIVTDRGSQFISRFWNRVCSHLSIDHRLSTSLHPQTDGQTERQNQTTEQYPYLRAGQLVRSITVSRISLRTTTRCT
jgi:hypothetical protein